MDFRGLIAYPVTPFMPDTAINTAELDRHIAQLAVSGVDGIAVLGSSGSFAYLNRQERAHVVRTAVGAARAANPGLPVYAGISAVGTREILEHLGDAEAAGAAGVVLSAVSYIPLSLEEVAAQTRTVAAASALPICLYNNPGTTQFDFTPELVAELAQLPAVVAFKDSAPTPALFAERYRRLAALVPDTLAHGLSGDRLIVGGECAADAWHSGPMALLPEPYLRLRRAVLAGDTARTAAVRARLEPVIRALLELRPHSGIHALARACGIDAGDPRPPLLPVAGSVLRDLARLVDTLDEDLDGEPVGR